jgi:hypothetical protein
MQLSEKAQASINRVIEKFQSGDLSPITKVARIQLDPAAPAYRWSLSNKVLAFMQAEELDCRGFVQWQQVGRHVKKGSKAVYILRPHTLKQTTDHNGEEKEELVCIGFSTVPVFAASDTEGEALGTIYQPQVLPPLLDVAKKFAIDVSYIPITPERLGDTSSDGSRIRIGSHNPSVFFHELAHAIHAQIDGGLKGGQHTNQETIAEFTTTVLMDFYGIKDHSGSAWNYISHYAQDPLLAITKAMGTVEKILAILLNPELNGKYRKEVGA